MEESGNAKGSQGFLQLRKCMTIVLTRAGFYAASPKPAGYAKRYTALHESVFSTFSGNWSKV